MRVLGFITHQAWFDLAEIAGPQLELLGRKLSLPTDRTFVKEAWYRKTFFFQAWYFYRLCSLSRVHPVFVFHHVITVRS